MGFCATNPASWEITHGSSRFLPGHRWAHLAGPAMGVTPSITDDPAKYGLKASSKPGVWQAADGSLVDVAANRVLTGPATGKAFWPQLQPRVISPEEAAWAAGQTEKGVIDYLTDVPKGFASDLAGAARTVSSSASSLPQKLESTVRALTAPAAALAAASLAPLGIKGKIVSGALGFLGGRWLEKKV